MTSVDALINTLGVACHEIRRLALSPVRRGLFGPELKAKLRGPVLWHGAPYNEESGFHSGDLDVDDLGKLLGQMRERVERLVDPTIRDPQNVLARLYARFGKIGQINHDYPVHDRIAAPAAIFDLDGSTCELCACPLLWERAGMDRARRDVRDSLSKLYPDALQIFVSPTTFGVDKLREAQVVPAINKTLTIAQVFRSGIPKKAAKARLVLERLFGPHWIVKSRKGFDSADSNMTDDVPNADLRIKLKKAIRANRGRGQVIVQRRAESREVGWFGRWLDQRLGDFTRIAMAKKEYRVHVVNGQVVPFATYGRGSTLDYIWVLICPVRPKFVRLAEETVQRAMDSMTSDVDRFKAAYGFDVGIDQQGQAFIVETNPSEGGIASSWFNSPLVADAVVSGARGKLPIWVRVRNALYAGLLVALLLGI